MADQSKATIYVDIDDEITNVIDKVLDSSAKVIALVLPKRASVFQSTVNMKLLKRKSENVSKKVVLVTNESNILPLAGSVGIFVAKTLNSKPEIPPAPIFNQSMIEASEDEEPLVVTQTDQPEKDLNLKENGSKTLAQIASDSTPLAITKLDKDLDTIDLDNTELANKEDNEESKKVKPKKSKKEKNKEKIKIPNFKKFKVISILVVLLILIGIIGYVALSILPSATIDINTDSSNVNANVSFTADPSTSSVNLASNTIPAKEVKVTKNYNASVNTTGQQNNGQKATGQVSVSYSDCNNNGPIAIPAGTGITQNNLTYITQTTVNFNNSGIKHLGTCYVYSAQSTNITAQQGGSSYNTQNNNTTFDIPGYSSSVTATGGASGGTDNIITVVSQNDITNAQNKISPNNNSVKNSLSSQLTQSGYYPISMTFNASTPNVTENNQVGAQASSVTVTETITYTMYGVFKRDLNTLLDNNISSQVGNSESVLSTGLSTANFSYTNGNTNPTQITVQSTAVVGPNINVNLIKTQAEGKKIAQIKNIVESSSNVTGVKVTLSPFYVSSAPNNPSKIHIHIAKPTKTIN